MSSVYIVTGGARGIGHELVKKLLADGNTVVSTVRGPSTALSTLAESTGARLIILECDIACAESVKKFGEELGKRVSQVDVLINNAGICSPPPDEDMSNLQPSVILNHFQTNVIGTLLVTQASASLFHTGTKVVNISSMVGSFAITLSRPIPSVASYSISKVALNMLTVKQALFYKDGIVVTLDPGTVKTDMNPLGPNSAEDVAASILVVISDLTKEDSGASISWDGKKLAW